MSERYTPCPVCKGQKSHHAACSVPVLGLPVDAPYRADRITEPASHEAATSGKEA